MWINRIEMNDPSIGIITSGITYQYAREALPNASILKLGIINPLPRKLIESFAAKVDRLYVIEELQPVIEEQVKSWGISVIGKEVFPSQGELSANIIAEKVLGEAPKAGLPQRIPARPPVMCPGCPHRGVFYVIRKLGLHATGDIGCYTLGALPPLQAMDTCVCMGASIGMAHGMEKARGRDFGRKLVAVIGDSTFIHSGITGLIDVVYNQGNSTVVILDNSTTGMTGHQDHPGTGHTLKGNEVPPLDLVKLAEAVGIKHISVVDPFDLARVENVLREEVQRDEPSVIIMQRPCALLDRSPKAPVEIDQDLCRKCNVCLRLGCPAIQKKQDAVIIDQSLCNGCGLCISVC
jgi:indolepyruvate ferredoxin oxidoreductase alpha subunit